MVRETLNGYAVQVLVVPSNVLTALKDEMAERLGLRLPDGYRFEECTREKAERQLQRLAEANGWVEIDT